MYREQGPAVLDRHGFDVYPELWEYYARAMAALKKPA